MEVWDALFATLPGLLDQAAGTTGAFQVGRPPSISTGYGGMGKGRNTAKL